MKSKAVVFESLLFAVLIMLALIIIACAAYTDCSQKAVCISQKPALADITVSSRPQLVTTANNNKNGVLVNINTATAQELAMLDSIGYDIAQRIISYRQKHGKFASAKDLLDVDGIAEKRLKKIENHICF